MEAACNGNLNPNCTTVELLIDSIFECFKTLGTCRKKAKLGTVPAQLESNRNYDAETREGRSVLAFSALIKVLYVRGSRKSRRLRHHHRNPL